MAEIINRRSFLSAGTVAGAAAVLLPHAGAGAASAPARPVANTAYGPVQGFMDKGICVFKGIRYGADTRPTRFQPPAKPKPWHEVRPATEYGPTCPQGGSHAPKISEDCLFLNIWTPALHDNGKRPVMFYLHGGAYAHGDGSDPLYDGVNLCHRGNCVVVTINHRINLFGYMFLKGMGGEKYADAGNAGMLDIIQALKWVQENIAEFGGDPDRVLVFGQSGGGAKIATMLAMPKAKGLFQRAITMSGQQVTACGPLNGIKRRNAFMAKMGAHSLQDLTDAPTEKLVAALSATDPVIGSGGVYFGPVLDFRNLMRHPFFPDAPAQSNAVPMMLGNTHDETRCFITDDWAYNMNWAQLPGHLIPNMRVDIDPDYVIAKYREWFPGITPSDLFFKATTAARSWRGAIEEDEARARANTPTWAYQVNFSSRSQPKLGAPHGIDIPLAFDNTHVPGAVTGNTPEARKMAAIVSETFLAFARTGNPDNKLIGHWPHYSMAKRETMIWDVPPGVQNDPRGRERELFAKVPFIQQGT